MDKVKVDFKTVLETGDDGHEELSSFKFVIKFGPIKMRAAFSQYNVKTIKWEKFANAVKNNDTYTLEFLDSNGFVGIVTKNGNTYFSVSKYGSYNDGDLDLRIENKYCVEAFEKALVTITEYNNRVCTKNEKENDNQ